MADDFAGVGVDDAHVEVGDEQDDAGSVVWSSESDVVHVAVDSQADASGTDAVVTDARRVWIADGDVLVEIITFETLDGATDVPLSSDEELFRIATTAVDKLRE